MIFLSRPKNRGDAGLGRLDLAVSMIDEEVEPAGVADLLPPAAIRFSRMGDEVVATGERAGSVGATAASGND